MFELITVVVMAIACKGCCKSNYHTITTSLIIVVRYNDEHAYKKLDADYSSTNILGLKYHALT
jgi:hypothetical protein